MSGECGTRRLAASNFARAGDGEFCFACRHTSMVQLGCRPWNVSLISVIVLAFSNVLLTLLLLQTQSCNPNISELLEKNAFTEWKLVPLTPETPQQCVTQIQPIYANANTLRIDVRLGKWDSRRILKTFDFVLVGLEFSSLSNSHQVCLATQSSLEKLHSIVQVAHHWTGPISVAVYIAGDEEFDILQKYLVYLRECYEPVRERIAFSLAVPANRTLTKQPKSFELPDGANCVKPEATLSQLVGGLSKEQRSWRIQNPYPQNHLRNLARKNCQTRYVFMTDVDIIPCLNLTRTLNDFLKNDRCDKCAYVVPTYELDSRIRFPPNKSELVRLAKRGLARPFHQKVFIYNQYATNFTRWMLDVSPGYKGDPEHLKSGRVYVSHDVTNFEFLYEPFYVARDTVPSHDERFVGYGYTRNSQVYEMYVAGYQFKVLSPIFTGHWGLQTKKGRPAWRERQNSANRKLLENFKKEVFARYMRDPLKMIKNSN